MPAKSPNLTSEQFIGLCRYLLLSQYAILSMHFISTALIFFAAFHGKPMHDADLIILCALFGSFVLTGTKKKFFKGAAYVGGGTTGEVGLSLPARTNYTFWGLWSGLNLMMAIFALFYCAKAAFGGG